MLFDILAQDTGLFLAAFSKGDISTPPRKSGELHENVVQKERQPDTFTAPVKSHQIHSVIPVTATHQGEAVLAKSQAVHDRTRAMIIQTCRLFRTHWKIVIRIFIRADWPSFEERNRLIQHPHIACSGDITADHQRQPEVIIRTARTNTPSPWRMPPVLNIAFYKLVSRGPKQMLTNERGLSMNHRHHILQLIAESKSAPRLIISAASPQ